MTPPPPRPPPPWKKRGGACAGPSCRRWLAWAAASANRGAPFLTRPPVTRQRWLPIGGRPRRSRVSAPPPTPTPAPGRRKSLAQDGGYVRLAPMGARGGGAGDGRGGEWGTGGGRVARDTYVRRQCAPARLPPTALARPAAPEPPPLARPLGTLCCPLRPGDRRLFPPPALGA